MATGRAKNTKWARWLSTAGLIIVVTLPATTMAAERTGLKATAWKPLCKLTTELSKVSGEMLNKGQEVISNIQKIKAAEYKVSIYLAKNPETQALQQSTLLRGYFARKTNGGLESYKTMGLATQIRSARAAAYLKGSIDEFLNLLESLKGGSENKCLVTTNADTAATRRETKLDDQECALSMPETKPEAATRTELTQTGYPNLQHGGGGTANTFQPTTSTGTCKLLSGHSTNGYPTTSALDTTAKVLAGYMTIPNTQVEATLANMQAMGNGHKATAPAWHEAWEARNREAKAKDLAYTNETGNLDTQPTLKALVKTLLLPKDNTEHNAEATKLEALFGGLAADKTKTYLDMVDAEIIPAGIAGRTTEAPLGKIHDTVELGDILSNYEMIAAQNVVTLKKNLDAVSKKQQTESAENKEKICNAAKDNQKACENLKEKGCVFNTESNKCELKKDVKEKLEKESKETEGKDEKANTTGSNSFLIHKAPLLLAFLLF
uniref:Variant surface glycoprotein MITAT 1.1 n=1 Tax=Trypanosoma brucei brucei TaxID=5702 RepID=VSM1_TRYBB|nr:RecName: Full=Variant surface glycoprotein MITAT 1.1; Short=VSG; Flags: Precursor [Trypanosoma brucei brucei]